MEAVMEDTEAMAVQATTDTAHTAATVAAMEAHMEDTATMETTV